MTKEIDKLAWLYIRNGKLLSARSKNKALFYLPGGKRELGESDEQALIREIQEEISVNLIANSINYAGTFKAQAPKKRLSDRPSQKRRVLLYFAPPTTPQHFETVVCTPSLPSTLGSML